MRHACLQQVPNAGRRIDVEYGLGRRRTEPLMLWPVPDGCQARCPAERKVHGPGPGLRTVVANGVRQTAACMDVAGGDSGHFVVFDLLENRSWPERVPTRVESVGGPTIGVWGM